MKDTANVTVLMSVRNGERYLPATLDSILGQTYRDFELLVIDDGSTDRTPELLRARTDPRMRVVRQEPRGLTASLQHGVELARGRYIARMDADDVADPERLAAQTDTLDADPGLVLVGSWAHIVDSRDRVLERARPPVDDAAIKAQLLWGNSFFHSTLMIRAAPLRAAGGYDTRIDRAQDYELAWRMGKVGRLANLPRALVRWRRSPTAISVVHRESQLNAAGQISLGALTEAVGPIDAERFWRVRDLWDGRRHDLLAGDAKWLASILPALPRAIERTVWVELIAIVSAARPSEAPSLLGEAWRVLPGTRHRLLTPKRAGRILLGSHGLRVGLWLRRRLRGY